MSVLVIMVMPVRGFLFGDLSPNILHVDLLDLTYEVFESRAG